MRIRNMSKGGCRLLRVMIAMVVAVIFLLQTSNINLVHANGDLFSWGDVTATINGNEVTLTFTIEGGGDRVLTGAAFTLVSPVGGWTVVGSTGFDLPPGGPADYIAGFGYIAMGNIFGDLADPIVVPHTVSVTILFPDGLGEDMNFNAEGVFEYYVDGEPGPGHTSGPGSPNNPGGGHVIVNPSAPTTFTVTFDLAGGVGDFPPQTVNEGGVATRPAVDPTRAGFTFTDWSHDFSTPITGNITVTALWAPIVEVYSYFDVTFDLAGGVGNFPVQRVRDGQTATRPAVEPTREGYSFVRWDHDFSTPITRNLTVTAVWERIGGGGGVFTVTFNLAGGVGDFPAQTVSEGELAVRPATNPTRDGYRFVRWDHDFSTPITRDITITAQWERVQAGNGGAPQTGDNANAAGIIGSLLLSAVAGILVVMHVMKKRKQ